MVSVASEEDEDEDEDMELASTLLELKCAMVDADTRISPARAACAN